MSDLKKKMEEYNKTVHEIDEKIGQMALYIQSEYNSFGMVDEFSALYQAFINNRDNMSDEEHDNAIYNLLLDVPFLIRETRLDRERIKQLTGAVKLDRQRKFEEQFLQSKEKNKEGRTYDANQKVQVETYVLEAYDQTYSKLTANLDFLEKAQSSLKHCMSKRLSDRKFNKLENG